MVRGLQVVALLLAAITGAMALVAAAAPWLGLGAGEVFFAYAWFGLARRALVIVSVSICLAALLAAALLWVYRAGTARALSALAPLFLVMISVTLTYGMLEAVVRIGHGVPVFAWKNFLAERNSLLTTHTLNQFDAVLGWVLREHQRVNPESEIGSLTTGAHGVRLNASQGPQPMRGAILAAGDSFTAGSEVGDRHSWPAHLETILGQPVVNAATGAGGADQIVLRLEMLMPVLAPKVIIASFLDDDIMRA